MTFFQRMRIVLCFVCLWSSLAEAQELVHYRWNSKVPELGTVAKWSVSDVYALPKILGYKETIRRGPQMLGPARIAGTWMQHVESESGAVLFAAGAYYPDLPRSLLSQVIAMEKNTASVLSALKISEAGLRNASFLPTKLEIAWDEGKKKFLPYWLVEYLDKDQSDIFFLKVDEHLQVIARGSIGAHLDGEGKVYPAGPLRSALSTEALTGLSGDGTLSGEIVQVRSAMNISVLSPNLQFFFPPDDPRFPQVQVYYFASKALRWFQEEFGAVLPRPLGVQVQIGNNGVSNAAFYHDYTVYLGSGDGRLYKDMLKDPSIVIHEVTHAFVDAYAGLPTDGEGGSLNEGFADLFACLLLDTPNVGEVSYVPGPYRRTIQADLKVQDLNKTLYHDGDIVAATFWDLRGRLGRDAAARIAFRTLARLGAGAMFKDLFPALKAALASEIQGKDYDDALALVAKRGWGAGVP